MITISLCMIVKNEEKVLARCLDSIADLMDEIIIVDTGSSDNTKEIAKNTPIKFMILHGSMTFRRHVIILFPRRQKSIFMWQMQMK